MRNTGTIFNIQRFCTDDGPGIRTSVFLKGCPLRCQWCANPESQAHAPQVLFDARLCKQCGACSETARQDASVCRHGALTLHGRSVSVEDVLDVCLRDADFYAESGGGVTVTGGEPLMQPDFLCMLLEGLRAHGIHTALETTAFAAPDVFARVLSLVDLFLLDIKHYDEAKHVEGTGVPLSPIVENLRIAVKAGKSVLVRIPVIPGYNDAEEDAAAFCGLLLPCGVRSVQLLPFHQMGAAKYDMLHMPYAYKDVPGLSPEALAGVRKAFEAQGMTVVE